MKEHRFHHVGFVVELTGTIVVSSITQPETGRVYSNIGFTFASIVVIGPLNAKSGKYAISVEEEITTTEALVKQNLDLLKMVALSLEVRSITIHREI